MIVPEGSHDDGLVDTPALETVESETKVEMVEVSLERLVVLVQQLVALLDASQDTDKQGDGKRSIDLQIAAKLLSSLIRVRTSLGSPF